MNLNYFQYLIKKMKIENNLIIYKKVNDIENINLKFQYVIFDYNKYVFNYANIMFFETEPTNQELYNEISKRNINNMYYLIYIDDKKELLIFQLVQTQINLINKILFNDNETYQMNKLINDNKAFLDATSTKKGFLAEDLIVNKINDNEIIFKNVNIGVENFDYFFITKDLTKCYFADAKAKAARNYFPDTGIDTKFFDKYLDVSTKFNLDFKLIFIDENRKEIYGNFLNILNVKESIIYKGKSLTYPLINQNIIYFLLKNMDKYFDLTTKECNDLLINNTRNYGYTSSIKKYDLK